jgi:hypothetical protein
MSETDLQIAAWQVSGQKQRVLRQHAVVLSLRRQGGETLESATALLDLMKGELTVMESRLERLVLKA